MTSDPLAWLVAVAGTVYALIEFGRLAAAIRTARRTRARYAAIARAYDLH